jgi:hypothetical protein
MPMEAAAVDKLVEKGEFRPQVAQAIAEAIDITIKAANFVTVPLFDARFAAHEAKMEARFGSIEKSIEATKVWATLLYAGLTIALFGALAVDHHWLVTREDQLMSQMWARSDANVAEQQTRIDRRFAEQEAQSRARFAEQQTRNDALFAQRDARSDQLLKESESRLNTKLDQLRTLIIGTSKRTVVAQPSPPDTSHP